MNKNSNPLDYLIQCCEAAIATGNWHLDKFTVLNAKDELKRLREIKTGMAKDAFLANKAESESNDRWLSCEKELVALKEKINLIFSKPVAYGLINDRHDLYDLSLHYNMFNDTNNKLIPLYSNREEFLNKNWQNGQYTK
jgi:hypothetical protein